MSAHAGCAVCYHHTGSTFLIQTPPLPTLRSSFTAASDQVTDKPSYKTRGSMPNHRYSKSHTAAMCQYNDLPYIYEKCEEIPRHIVIHRLYELCERPQNVGTYRHCSDEWATKSDDILAGSSRAKGDCITCADPTRTVVISYV
ncbi:hypothetical protein CIHG_10090 [Coccidioides immitis H538.4]|uniref:Uncharacterized protein n=1 Tax=Coccidioides immitis H538.4 TaxID=396776 RepID=A0A0J8UWL5_COCIT|nr:hypothetical protein CIHG_10090 [Coccidioides immitis H538.4]